MTHTSPDEIVGFWQSIGPKGWFRKDDAVDQQMRRDFASIHEQGAQGKLFAWQEDPVSSLALIILLDQFSRNMYRDSANAFSQDEMAISCAEYALSRAFDTKVAPELASFFYMPFMHSERISDQNRCVALFHALHSDDSLKFAIIHRDIIGRFGRFPHRNTVLSRHTTPAERAFLEAGGFSG
ncbi:MAG: DUF924 family protein [Rhizobiaceae bacterium]